MAFRLMAYRGHRLLLVTGPTTAAKNYLLVAAYHKGCAIVTYLIKILKNLFPTYFFNYLIMR